MHVAQHESSSQRYTRCIEVSKRIRWEIDRDVIRGRTFDFDQKFLPDGLTKADLLPFLNFRERVFLSQVQGRTYANMFRLVERFIGAKMLEVGRGHALGDQVATEAIVRLADEELKHQELFRRIEILVAAGMPGGYRFALDPNDVAAFVLNKSSWAILALTCDIEIFSQVHYRQSIESDDSLSPLFKDVFMYHWKEESQHAILDELEWTREDAKLDDTARNSAVDDLIALVIAVDGLVQLQAQADTDYFCANVGRSLTAAERDQVGAGLFDAYRWQYILSGVEEPRFENKLTSLVNEEQANRIGTALAPIRRSRLEGTMRQ
jgi:hypothetical protein